MNLTLNESITIAISAIALGFAMISFIRTRDHEKYKISDDMLLEILKINIEYPEFDNPEFTENFMSHDDLLLKKRYDIYAMMVWNYMESLYDYYGTKKIQKICYWGAIQYWSKLHYKWFALERNYCAYQNDFRKFIENSNARESLAHLRSSKG